MHSVAHHSLDVAAVASVLLETFVPSVPVSPSTIAGLMALHDIGKFTRTFQAKDESLWPAALGPYAQPPSGFPHDDTGFSLLTGPLADLLDRLFAAWPTKASRAPLLRAIAGHHGRPPREHDRVDLPRMVACPACMAAASAFIAAAFAAIDPSPLPPLKKSQRTPLAWFLAGLAVAADWIGSARSWFPLVLAAEHADLARYWREHALPNARRAVHASGLVPASVVRPAGLHGIFPDILALRPVQEWAERVRIPAGPALLIIEDATGSGKTETALVLAHRLMATGRAEGLFFALPTMATANAMYGRLAGAYARLFASDARPSLVLAHGRRLLNTRFAESILDTASEPAPLAREPADEPAGAQCAAWIGDDRRKAFLAEIGIGTIDQAILAVLPTRHAPLRLFGLSRRVLIIDEAHAYDVYMSEELRRLVTFHAALGGSAIVLSATLTASQRSDLAAAFLKQPRSKPPTGNDAPYPQVTIVSAAGVQSAACEIAPDSRRTVTVERVGSSEESARILAEAADAGAAVAWIRNAVDDALEAADHLCSLGRKPVLFHARFAMGDRLAIESEVCSRFGKYAEPTTRAGQLLVATQVVEQSLDLDFDLIVSDLAPADLIIQRSGRLWRHQRPARPIPGPRLFLLAPEPTADPPEDWLGPALRRTGAVYGDHSLLWRSARALLASGKIVTPEGIRPLIESAYDRDADGAVPAGLRRATDRAVGKWYAARGAAWQNLLEFDRPYERRAGLWEPDARTPTRLGDPHLKLRLAKLESNRVVPWCSDGDSRTAWGLSEISLRTARFAAALPDPETEPLIAAAKKSWPGWDQEIPVLVLRPGPDGSMQAVGLSADGRVQRVRYSVTRGLSHVANAPPPRAEFQTGASPP